MRARYPDRDGYVARDGVKIFYEIYGEGKQTILLLPSGRSSTRGIGRRRSLTSRGTFRVVTLDGRVTASSCRSTRSSRL
jgi:pimeloyl-ACP methyl ester carboxylesterase